MYRDPFWPVLTRFRACSFNCQLALAAPKVKTATREKISSVISRLRFWREAGQSVAFVWGPRASVAKLMLPCFWPDGPYWHFAWLWLIKNPLRC